MSVRKTLTVLLGSGLLLGATHLSAAGATATMLADTCVGCHGPEGSSVGPAIPSIAGMSAEYFNTVMKEYKDGTRYGTIMNRIAKGYSDEEIEERFGHLLEAFDYGAPPHGGIAPGIDRMVMLLAGEETIREGIAFPKNQSAMDLTFNAPSSVTEEQLAELHLQLRGE